MFAPRPGPAPPGTRRGYAQQAIRRRSAPVSRAQAQPFHPWNRARLSRGWRRNRLRQRSQATFSDTHRGEFRRTRPRSSRLLPGRRGKESGRGSGRPRPPSERRLVQAGVEQTGEQVEGREPGVASSSRRLRPVRGVDWSETGAQSGQSRSTWWPSAASVLAALPRADRGAGPATIMATGSPCRRGRVPMRRRRRRTYRQ